LQSLIASVKSETDKAVNVGFGVSTPDQAKLIQSWGADGVIVGSALVNLLGNGESEEAGIEAMKSLVVEMRKALG
jgi:tryptophan synthase alpha subunit